MLLTTFFANDYATAGTFNEMFILFALYSFIPEINYLVTAYINTMHQVFSISSNFGVVAEANVFFICLLINDQFYLLITQQATTFDIRAHHVGVPKLIFNVRLVVLTET